MRLTRWHKEERGLSRTWWLLILLVVIGGIYIGIKIFGPYFHYWMIQDAVTEFAKHYAKVKPKNDDEVIQKILEEARNQELPMDPENVHYYEADGNLYLSAEWTEQVSIPYYTHQFKFKTEAKEQLLR